MQIVIDIPEELKNKIDNANEDNYKTYLWWFETTLYCAIKKGTPLPKKHGRISDMDEVIKCIKEIEGEDAIWAISLIEWACDKRTIIEADKAEESDKESEE